MAADKESLFIYAVMGFVLLVCLKVYSESDAFNLKCIISEVDGQKYCVRERTKLQPAADLLAKVIQRCQKLVEYMGQTHSGDLRVQRLVQKFNPSKVSETLPTSEFTAYTENKGEKMAFCLNKNKESNAHLIDEQTLTFVALHELAHIMTESEGHLQDYWHNFKFILENAKAANIYNPVDYKKDPVDYCGMTISDNPYFDM